MSVGKSLREFAGKKLSRHDSALMTAQQQQKTESENVRTLKLRGEVEELRAERKRIEQEERDKRSKLKRAERILAKGGRLAGKGLLYGARETFKLYKSSKKQKKRSKKFRY